MSDRDNFFEPERERESMRRERDGELEKESLFPRVYICVGVHVCSRVMYVFLCLMLYVCV